MIHTVGRVFFSLLAGVIGAGAMHYAISLANVYYGAGLSGPAVAIPGTQLGLTLVDMVGWGIGGLAAWAVWTEMARPSRT